MTMSLKQSEKEEPANKQNDLINPEQKIEGGVTLQDYRNMLSFSKNSWASSIIIGLNLVSTLAQLMPSYIVSLWVGQTREEQQSSNLYPIWFGSSVLFLFVWNMMRNYLQIYFII